MLDPTYKWYHMVFFFFGFIMLIMIISTSIFVATDGVISSFLRLSNILCGVCVCVCVCVCVYLSINLSIWLWLRSWTPYCQFRLKLKKVGKTTRPLRYDLNQIPYDYAAEVRNRFKGLDLFFFLIYRFIGQSG